MSDKTNTQRIYVDGMHCSACQHLVRQQIMGLPGVLDVEVSLGRKTADVSVVKDAQFPALADYIKVLRKFDYIPHLEKPAARAFSIKEWIPSFLLTGAILFVFLLIQRSGLIEFSQVAQTPGTSRIFALLMGFAASLSSCLAVTGSIVLAFSVIYAPDNSRARPAEIIKPNVLFHAGRIGFFAIGGFILGAIGGKLVVSGQVMGIFQMAVAVIMLLLAVSLLGLSLGGKSKGKGFFSAVQTRVDKLKSSRHPLAPVILGALTFFLPCGFTQTMQIYALASGSPLQGGIILALFAAGTLPVLLAAGLTASWSSKKSLVPVRRAAGLLIIVFSVYTFFSATNVIGFKGDIMPDVAEAPAQTFDPPATGNITPPADPAATDTVSKPAPQEPAPQVQAADTSEGTSVIEMHVKYEGFTPGVLTVKKGDTVTWNVYGDEVTGCTSAIIVPDLGLKFKVKKGLNTVTFTADKAGTIDYSCWMGMVWGKIVVK